MKHFLVLALWAGLVLAAGAADGPAAWLTFPAGLNFDFSDRPVTGPAPVGPSLRIPVVPQTNTLAVSSLQAHLRDAVFRNGREESLAAGFHAEFRDGDADHGAALVVWTTNYTLAQGTYFLTYDIVSTNPNFAKVPPQVVTLTLQRPAPDIGAGPPVVLEQVWYGPRQSGEKGLLLLEERSGKSPATGLTFAVFPETKSGTGTLEFLTNVPGVPAGATVPVMLRPQGDFPLGTSKGKIRIRTQEQEKPVEVAYEVHSRRTPLWIVLLVALGFLVGYLVRHTLHDRQEVALERVAAVDGIDSLREAMKGVGDPVFRGKVEVAIGKLEAAKAEKLAVTIRAAVDQAKASLTDAQNALATALDKTTAACAPWHGCLDNKQWVFPLPIDKLLRAAMAAMTEVQQLLDGRNPTEAGNRLDQAKRKEFFELANGSLAWRKQMAEFFLELKDSPPPQADPALLSAAIDNWRTQHDSQAANFPSVTPEGLDAELSQGNEGYSHADVIANTVFKSTHQLLAFVESRCAGLKRPDPKRFTETSRAAAGLVREAVDRPEEVRKNRLPEVRAALVDAWKIYLTGILPSGTDPKVIAAVKAAIEGNCWKQAAEQAAANGQADAPPVGSLTGKHVAGGDVLKIPAESFMSLAVTPATPPLARLRALARPQVPPTDFWQKRRFLREAEEASVAQTAILGGLFAVVAYALYEKAWVGTSYEMIGIFFWTFGMDISSDALVNAAKKIRLPEA